MPLRQIIQTLHFHQARDGAFELKPTIALGVKNAWQRIGSRNQLHLMLIKRVNQRHEPGSFIAIFRPQLWDTDKNDRVKMPRDRQIVRCTPRLGA